MRVKFYKPCGMQIWFQNETAHLNKCISIAYYLNRWLGPLKELVWWKNNGAKKGTDPCYDFNMEIFGLHFGYTNFDYSPGCTCGR